MSEYDYDYEPQDIYDIVEADDNDSDDEGYDRTFQERDIVEVYG